MRIAIEGPELTAVNFDNIQYIFSLLYTLPELLFLGFIIMPTKCPFLTSITLVTLGGGDPTSLLIIKPW